MSSTSPATGFHNAGAGVRHPMDGRNAHLTWLRRHYATVLLAFVTLVSPLAAQTLEEDLKRILAAELAALATREGDAIRGAVVFFSCSWPAQSAMRSVRRR